MNLKLSGELIPDEWAEIYREFNINSGYFCASDIRSAMESLPEGEELVLEVNSVGGSVDSAAEIYSMLEACKNPTRAVIQSLAASAASYCILSADRVEITLPAQMMIHCASLGSFGNKDQLRHDAQVLEATDSSILDVYCRKCGDKASREHLQELMEAETYLTATECLELGLVDAITGSGEEPKAKLLAASVMNNTVRAMRTLPDIGDLIARKNAETAQLDDQLKTEKSRYNNT